MSLEYAAQLVSRLQGMERIELFDHFVKHFKLDRNDECGIKVMQFAAMCGFVVMTRA